MRQLFLTSEVASVAADIARNIVGPKRTAFITTPLERGHEDDDLQWHRDNKTSMQEAGFEIFEYTITGKTRDDLEHDFAEADVIYVEGGSLVWMMNQARSTGFDDFIREFVNKGGIYIGTSTGSFIAAEDTAPGLELENYFEEDFDTRGIGLVNFLVMPHWGTEDFRESYGKLPGFAYAMKTPMVVLNDKQYVWVQGETFSIVDLAKD
jgi:peptidase E